MLANNALRACMRQYRRLATRGIASSATTAASAVATAPATLPDLPYGYGELEPVISGQIMEIHHSKHHQAYVTNFNLALEQYQEAEAAGDAAKMIALQGAIKFNGGGHVNHSIFWQNLAPVGKGGGDPPTGALAAKIDATFGSLDALQATMSAQSAAVQGSGWGWLGYDAAGDRLAVATCANQDPLSTVGLVPLLGIDVWEHAYYLDYKNVRPDYLKEIWKVVNWADVGARFDAAQA